MGAQVLHPSPLQPVPGPQLCHFPFGAGAAMHDARLLAVPTPEPSNKRVLLGAASASPGTNKRGANDPEGLDITKVRPPLHIPSSCTHVGLALAEIIYPPRLPSPFIASTLPFSVLDTSTCSTSALLTCSLLPVTTDRGDALPATGRRQETAKCSARHHQRHPVGFRQEGA